jgi:hypothetical protein
MIGICADLWPGGYYIGDPKEPMGISRYQHLSYISSLYAIYQVCIKPYINQKTRAIEIGPGRGSWTKTMLGADEVWCLDVLDALHNMFWAYMGIAPEKTRIRYQVVSDFSCDVLPDAHFDYLFSYGTFCHIPWEGQQLYYRNLYPKLLPGAMCFVMYANATKYNWATKLFGDMVITVSRNGNLESLSIPPSTKMVDPNDTKWAWGNKWFSIDASTLKLFLQNTGYEVVNEDVGLNLRDPIIQFRKPQEAK